MPQSVSPACTRWWRGGDAPRDGIASPSRYAPAQARAAIAVMRRRVDDDANMCSDTVANTCSVVKRRTLRTVELAFAHRSLALGGRAWIMAIVNVTPDSFYDR